MAAQKIRTRDLTEGPPVASINSDSRDAEIMRLRNRGWTYQRIGKKVGLTDRGVSAACKRIAEGRRGRVREA